MILRTYLVYTGYNVKFLEFIRFTQEYYMCEYLLIITGVVYKNDAEQ